LVGASALVATGERALETKSNFFLGNVPADWRTNVPNYAQVRAKDWLPGVDVIWHEGDAAGLEYDLEVSAGTDARTIALDIEGADAVRVDATGALALETSIGSLVQKPPRVLQSGRELSTRYIMLGPARVGFMIDGYDINRPVLIDPVLTYSTYLGGTNW